MTLYGCNNKPAQKPDATYFAQAGWHEYRDGFGKPVRMPRHVEIKAAFGTTTCQYDKPTTDPDCAGCWQAERAAQMREVV